VPNTWPAIIAGIDFASIESKGGDRQRDWMFVDQQGDITYFQLSPEYTFKDKQWDFAHNQHYAESDFERVNERVYQNLVYMSDVYYPALLFSYLFSSNYFAIYRNFCSLFIPLCLTRSGTSLEVGIGHGLLSSSLLHANSGLVGYGLDISPIAPEISSRVSSFFKLAHPITTVGDAASHIPLQSGAPYQVTICAEVLEHLPDPAGLLRNMESVDHLYLFHSDDEVLQMVEQCGFKPVNRDLAFLTVQPYRSNPKLVEQLKNLENPATAILIVAKRYRGTGRLMAAPITRKIRNKMAAPRHRLHGAW
jgi:2-polyprenyl-3-methyl-5-hydroxy-6-metoxy-1,4-benzoquinol methylase